MDSVIGPDGTLILPADARNTGFTPGTHVEVELAADGRLIISRKASLEAEMARWQELGKESEFGGTTDEFMALIRGDSD